MKWIVVGLLVIISLVLFPVLHTGVGAVNTTGFPSWFAGITTAMPYIFISIVIFIVMKVKRAG